MYMDTEEGDLPVYNQQSKVELLFQKEMQVQGNEMYIGQTISGVIRHGIGTLVDVSPGELSLYEGQFSNNRKDGFGRIIKVDFKRGSTVIEGMFSNHQLLGPTFSCNEHNTVKSYADEIFSPKRLGSDERQNHNFISK